MKRLLLALALLTACGKPGSSPSGAAAASGGTVLANYGGIYQVPMMFSGFRLNTSTAVAYASYSNGTQIASCEITETIEGTETAGVIKFTAGRTISAAPGVVGSGCAVQDFSYAYTTSSEGLTLYGGSFGTMLFRRQ